MRVRVRWETERGDTAEVTNAQEGLCGVAKSVYVALWSFVWLCVALWHAHKTHRVTQSLKSHTPPDKAT